MRALLLIGLFFLIVSKIEACICEDPGSVAQAYRDTEIIVHGRVLQKSLVTYESSMDEKRVASIRNNFMGDDSKLKLLKAEYIIKVDVEVLKVFKGKISEATITIFTTKTGASCGYTGFEECEDFIIYASSRSHAFWIFDNQYGLEKNNTFWTNNCTRTAEYDVSEAKELNNILKQAGLK